VDYELAKGLRAPHLSRTLLLTAAGYAAGLLAFSTQIGLLEPLRLFAPAAARGGTLDFLSLAALALGGSAVIISQSTRPAQAVGALKALWAGRMGVPELARTVAAYPAVKETGIATLLPPVYAAVCAGAIFALALALLHALQSSTLLLAPLFGEVSARGSPRAPRAALAISLPASGEGAQEVMMALAEAKAHATFFLPSPPPAGLIASLLAAQHEVGWEVGSGSVQALREAVAAHAVVKEARGRPTAAAAATPGAPSPAAKGRRAGSAPSPAAKGRRAGSAAPVARAAAAAAPAPVTAPVAGFHFVDTMAIMVTPAASRSGAPQSELVWASAGSESRAIGAVAAVNAAGLSLALWAAAAEGEAPLTSGPTPPRDPIATRVKEQLAGADAMGAIVRVTGPTPAALEYNVRGVLAALAELGVSNENVGTVSSVVPSGGRTNEVLRVGGNKLATV